MVCLHLENIKENPLTLFMNINFAKVILNMLRYSFLLLQRLMKQNIKVFLPQRSKSLQNPTVVQEPCICILQKCLTMDIQPQCIEQRNPCKSDLYTSDLTTTILGTHQTHSSSLTSITTSMKWTMIMKAQSHEENCS